MSKKLSKYIAAYKCFNCFSTTSVGVSNISFSCVIGVPTGIAAAYFTLAFSLAIGIKREFLEMTKNKKKKHNKIVDLAKSKLNSIETLLSQALIDLENSHDKNKKSSENGRSE